MIWASSNFVLVITTGINYIQGALGNIQVYHCGGDLGMPREFFSPIKYKSTKSKLENGVEQQVLKEWTYSGFFFTMPGAVFSHWASTNAAIDFLGRFC